MNNSRDIRTQAIQALPVVQYLREKIRQSLNPFAKDESMRNGGTMEKKLYLHERCSKSEFELMFPNAQPHGSKPVDLKKLPLCYRNKFKRTHKVYHVKFDQVRQLDYLLGEAENPLDMWDYSKWNSCRVCITQD